MDKEFDIREIEGVSDEDAARRLSVEGYNELPGAQRRGILAIAFDVIREPMLLLLVAVGAIYMSLGDRKQAAVLLTFVMVVIGITLYQERKTERALESLKNLSSPRANVIRSGEQKRIAGRDVVVGDMLLLAEGDRVPADAVLISCASLSVDESLLTGESVPVGKTQHGTETDIEMGRPGGDNFPFVWSGTLVVQGRGVARVFAVGSSAEMGKIGKALQAIKPERTPLQREIRMVMRNIALSGAVLCAMVIVVYGLTRNEPNHWLTGFLAGLTLAMAMLPEEFPVVLTIFLTTGAWRISKKEVLAREVPAVETLGLATVLCVDKTGTLTHNRISVSRLISGVRQYNLADHKREPLPEEFHQLVEFSILASQRDPFDPIEKAMKRLGDRKLVATEHLHDDWKLTREYPLSQELLALSRVWRSPDGKEYLIAAKGAPEAVSDLCHLSPNERDGIMKSASEMAADGLRVLGVARALFIPTLMPANQHEFAFEFLGLLGFADPVRSNVYDAIRECETAGIDVVMITGDYPDTARNIARQIGLDQADKYIIGPEMDDMTDDELRKRIKDVHVFARVVPEQKLRIVEAFKANGEVVAMTGDGVNDAPALKSANIGIAMGGRGTDVARESSDLVLLNDDFSSIVAAVRLGRRIYDNLKKAMAYILAVHVPIAGMSLIPVLFKLPLILLPVHIAFLEIIIDPACSVVFEGEPEESDVMTRPPRNSTNPLFSRRNVGISVLQGFFVMVVVLAVFSVSHWLGLHEDEARAMTFATMVIANLGLILVNRSWTRTIRKTLSAPNRAFWWVLGGTVSFLALALYVPFLMRLFKFGRLSAIDAGIAVIAGVASVAWFEALKLIQERQARA
ncbi:MAG: ATPase [Candidatus Anoxymicrobium japonicum]|uniref:ATPase n=1 Tax=Candidatus Anoxymicrobium japonicum TaxID=2013648 RepID=A0A2N3G725_9ACTN|nr:MAG: ATPase [Candidatus Anoxymicrobium japonicum]